MCKRSQRYKHYFALNNARTAQAHVLGRAAESLELGPMWKASCLLHHAGVAAPWVAVASERRRVLIEG